VTPVKYERKAFVVEAVQVTAENMTEVAEWCKGEILDCPPKYKRNGKGQYIKVPISVPPTTQFQERHAMAIVDDCVVFGQFGARGRDGWKIYQPRAFEMSFDVVTADDPLKLEVGDFVTMSPLDNLINYDEPACGRSEQTLDHKPCILGAGHVKGPRSVGCRSFQDYRLA
jgi:hypothetical protein